MKSGVCRFGNALAVVTTILLAWGNVAAENPDHAIERDGMSVREFHQRLAESKAAALGNRQFVTRVDARKELDIHQENYDVKLYDVFIRIDDTTEMIYGRVGIFAEATEASVEEVQVDFHMDMTVDSVVAPSGNLLYSHADDYIYVTLDRPYGSGEQLEFCVHYHGYGQLGGTGLGWAEFFYREGTDLWINTMSEPYGSRYFWPCKDRPDDKPDSMNIAIEVDTSLWVATNGVLDSVTYNGSNSETYCYSVRYPMATYLFALSITDFVVWTDYYYYNDGQDSMPIVNAAYPDLLEESVQGWGIAPEVMTIFADHFGEYPFVNEKYGHANVLYRGMEHQTVTAACGCDFGFSEYLVIHELAHHWWGNMITCKSWQDIWLNEGWATYSEAIYYKDIYGWDYYRDYLNALAYRGGGTIYVDDTTDAHRIFDNGLSYHKGAWVVHMLRGVLGDSLFYEGIDAWYHSEFQYGSATTEDFKNVWEEATGVELDYFIDEWIHGTYYPHYHRYFTSLPSDTGGYDVYLLVKQVQSTDPQVFSMPVDFAFVFEDGSTDTLTLFIDQRQQLFKFNYPSDIIDYGIIVDRFDWVLKDVTYCDWEFFIVTLDEELSDGEPAIPYADTIEVYEGSGDYVFGVVDGALPSGYSIDNVGVISGQTEDVGPFAFRIHAYDNVSHQSDEADFTIYIGFGCCGKFTGGITGNANCSEDGKLTLSDISRMIDRVYISKDPLCCEASGNTNGDTECLITLSDITKLIDAVYISKADPEACISECEL